MIDIKIGKSSSEKYPFDFDKLEKQALKYLKLEEEIMKSRKGSDQHNPCQYRIIIAACCYVQFKQQSSVYIKAKDLTKAYKKLMIQPDKALDFIKKCDLLHRQKVATEKHLSGANNFDNDESYSLIRIDQIDEIKPASPKEQRQIITNEEMSGLEQSPQYGTALQSHHYTNLTEMPKYETELQLPSGEPIHTSNRHLSNITMQESLPYGQPHMLDTESSERRN